MEPASTRERLGRQVKARREELGLSVRMAAKVGGLHRITWTSVEQGIRLAHGHNRAKIERVLGWAPGSIVSVLDGGAPTVADPTVADPTVADPTVDPPTLDGGPPTTVDVGASSRIAENLLIDLRYIDRLKASAQTRANLMHILITTYQEAEDEARQRPMP